jgi:hypothetical protein
MPSAKPGACHLSVLLVPAFAGGNDNLNFLLPLDEARAEWKHRYPQLPWSESI